MKKMVSITNWVAPSKPRPPVPGHLPDAVTEESQASEKSEASPSSTARENRDGPMSSEAEEGLWVGRRKEEKSFVGVPIIPMMGEGAKPTKRPALV